MGRPIRRATVFAHYDRDNRLDDYVKYLLLELDRQSDSLIVVSVSALDGQALEFLESRGIKLILRENRGYDFMSYKFGLEAIDSMAFDEIVLCNDSVYGPFLDLGKIFGCMSKTHLDFWGMTESYELSRHLQSYFLVFSAPVIRSEAFEKFWSEVDVLDSKRQIIELYEIGLSSVLLSDGFKMGAFVYSERMPILKRVLVSWKQYLRTIRRRWKERQFWLDVFDVIFRGREIAINPTHMEWLALLKEHRLPFLKIELLRDNPKGIDNLEKVDEAISSLGDYPTELIHLHLARVRAMK